jgi:hypothetical protein
MTPISRTLVAELHAPELVDLRLELLDNRSRSASNARASASIAFKASMSSGSGVVSGMRGSLRTSRVVYNIDSAVRVREGCFQLRF